MDTIEQTITIVTKLDKETLKQAGVTAAFGVHPTPVPLAVAAKNAFADLEKTAEKAFREIL